MSDSFKIAEAYVEFVTKGDPQKDIEAQQAQTDKANRWHQQRMRQYGGPAWDRFQTQRQRHMDRMTQVEGRVNREREQAEKQAGKDNEKLMSRMANIRKQQLAQVERFRAMETKADRDITAEQNEASNSRRLAMLKYGALTKVAFGSVPFVGAGADIAMAGAAGGALGAGAMAVGKGLQYGVQGAGMASPATMERLNYQLDRLQAGIGREFVPALQKVSKWLERASDKLFGKGHQLAYPHYSSFEEMRDRLQMDALREAGNGEQKPSFFERLGNQLSIPMSGTAGRFIDESMKGSALERLYKGSVFEKSWNETVKLFEGTMVQKFGRGVMTIFDSWTN